MIPESCSPNPGPCSHILGLADLGYGKEARIIESEAPWYRCCDRELWPFCPLCGERLREKLETVEPNYN